MLLHLPDRPLPAVARDAYAPSGFYRACPRHRLELLDQQDAKPIRIQMWCPGTATEEAHVIRPYSGERPWWWVIERASGRRVASCCRSKIEWEPWFLDAIRLSSVAGRDREGFGGQPAMLRVLRSKDAIEDSRERRRQRKRESHRRERERYLAALEGREPAEWAAIRTPAPKVLSPAPRRLRAYEKQPANPTWWQRYSARVQAVRDGAPVPEWAKRRKPGRVEGLSPWKRRSA